MNTNTAPRLFVRPHLTEVVWGRFIAPVLEGAEPHVESMTVEIDNLEPLVGDEVLMRCTGEERVALFELGDATVLASHGLARARVLVRGASAEVVAKAVIELRSRLPERAKREDLVTFDFWQVRGSHASTTPRQIEVPAWSSISHHYPAVARSKAEVLFAQRPSLVGGRIVLWHGPPGTGKTTAIRALAREWSDVRFQVVLDPDQLFAHSSLLMEALLDHDDEPERWRVLVIEDADELVRSDAKERVGQALSRLLNIGDGLLGQGTRVVVLITTNEPVGRLHPALVRPGRCLAEIEFPRFERTEARSVFGDALPTGADLSLAEIMGGGTDEASPSDARRFGGVYL